jgi:hypothetical protein
MNLRQLVNACAVPALQDEVDHLANLVQSRACRALRRVARRAGRRLVAPNGVVNFASMDRHVSWCLDPKPHFVAANIYDGDFNLVADQYAFVESSGED